MPEGQQSATATPTAPSTQTVDPKPTSAPQSPPVETKPAEPSADQIREELVKQQKQMAQAKMRFAQERQTWEKEREAHTQKLKQAEDYEKLRADRLRNPSKYLAQDFGENWYDTLTKHRIDGSVTPELVASELDARTKEWEARLDEREKKVEARFQELQRVEQERERVRFEADFIEKVKVSDKYPLIKKFGEYGSVLAEMQSHFKSTMKQDENGQWLGDLLTPDDAASRIEKRLEEYRSKFLETVQPSATAAEQNKGSQRQPGSTQQQPRRSLNTNITSQGTPSDMAPPKDDNERMRRLKAKWASQGS